MFNVLDYRETDAALLSESFATAQLFISFDDLFPNSHSVTTRKILDTFSQQLIFRREPDGSEITNKLKVPRNLKVSDWQQFVCYDAVTALTARFWQNGCSATGFDR